MEQGFAASVRSPAVTLGARTSSSSPGSNDEEVVQPTHAHACTGSQMEATLHHDGRPYSAQGTRLKKCTPKLGSRHKTQDMHMIVYSYRCSSLNAERSTRNEGASSYCTRKLNANQGDPFVTTRMATIIGSKDK